MPIDYTGPQGASYQDQQNAVDKEYLAKFQNDRAKMQENGVDPFGHDMMSDAAAYNRARNGLSGKYEGPQLGGQYGAATGIAQGYGSQAADMAGRSLSDRYSSQDRHVLDQARAQELAAIEYQRRLATGEIQSPAMGQATSGLAQAMSAQQSAAHSATGGGPAMALAQRNAANQSAMIAGQGRNDMAALQANEMAAARDRYAAGVNGLRSQDQSLWGLGQQREIGNASLNDQGVLSSQGMANQIQSAQLGADSSAYNTRLGSDINAEMAKAADQKQLESRIIGGATTAAGAAVASDERLKTDVKPMSGAMQRSPGLAGGMQASQPATNPTAPMKSSSFGAPKPGEPTDMYGHPQGYDPGPVTWAQTGMSSSDDTRAADPSFYSKNIGQQQSSTPQGLSTSVGASAYAPTPTRMPNQYANRGPAPSFGGGTRMVSEGTKMPQWYPQQSAGPQLGQFMSDERVKEDIYKEKRGHGVGVSVWPAAAYPAHVADAPGIYLGKAKAGTGKGLMSDAHVKADVHAEGYRAGVDDALSRLSTGNGTAAQRNADIDHALAGAGSQESALMPPKSRISPAAWDRMQNIRAGNGGQAAVNAELASMSRQLPAKPSAPPPRTIVNEGTWTPSPELAAREQFESRFPEAVGPQLGQYGNENINYLKNHNDYTRSRDVKRMPSPDMRESMREAALDQGAYNPEQRLVMSDERIKEDVTVLSPSEESAFQTWARKNGIRDVDHPDSHYDYRGAYTEGMKAGPDAHWPDTYKQHGHPTFSVESKYSYGPNDGGTWDSGGRFVPAPSRFTSTDYGQSKMRNESEHGPEKDPRRFPMPPRKLGEVMSDEKMKGQPHVEYNDVDSFLNSLKPHSYRYKDPSNEPTSEPTGGRYLGVMAQSVEKSPTGDTIVKDTPRGKMLEGGALMSALAAGTGRLHERISALEAKSKAK